jgi:pimeloyl-ACP methyl ester carboxylesterase
MVLLSAHGGGRDGVQRTSRAGIAGDRLGEITARARALVSAGRGRELMLVPGWWYVITAESFLDRMTEMPDVLDLAPTIRCPTLFIRGDEENPETYPAERFKERSGGACDVEIVKKCDHFYVGREAVISELVSRWLARTLSISAGR